LLRISFICFVILLSSVMLCAFKIGPCWAGDNTTMSSKFETVRDDYRNFYLDKTNLIQFGLGLGAACVIANTSTDREIRDFYMRNIKSDNTDRFSQVSRQPGEVFLTVPALLGVYAFLGDASAGNWAERSLRSIIVGIPGGLILQRAIGASCPSDGGSGWKPFNDDHGLSGHAFIGAVPFITAAKMNDNIYMKGAFYVLSLLPALSRINDDDHYFSQAALGWYLALLSCKAVEKGGKRGETAFLIVPAGRHGLAIVVGRSF